MMNGSRDARSSVSHSSCVGGEMELAFRFFVDIPGKM